MAPRPAAPFVCHSDSSTVAVKGAVVSVDADAEADADVEAVDELVASAVWSFFLEKNIAVCDAVLRMERGLARHAMTMAKRSDKSQVTRILSQAHSCVQQHQHLPAPVPLALPLSFHKTLPDVGAPCISPEKLLKSVRSLAARKNHFFAQQCERLFIFGGRHITALWLCSP